MKRKKTQQQICEEQSSAVDDITFNDNKKILADMCEEKKQGVNNHYKIYGNCI